MHHAGVVRVAQRVGHFARDLQGVADRELAFAVEALAQRLALDVRHDVVHQPVGLVRVVQRQDVRVVQPSGDLDLVQEPGGAHRLGQLGEQHLDRDVTVVLEIVGQEYARHPALAQLALEAVPRGQGVAQSFKKLGHGASMSPRRPSPGVQGDLNRFVANIGVLLLLARPARGVHR